MNLNRLSVAMGLSTIVTLTLLWLLFGQPSIAYADDITVCLDGPPTCDYDTIQDAADDANNGDIIKVAAGVYTDVQNIPGLDTATFTATQMVAITKSITLQGGYTTTNWATSDPMANPTVLDAQGQGRVLYVMGNISPTIEGLHITGGDATGLGGYDSGGGVYVITATSTISDCQIFSHTAYNYGGGVYLCHSLTMLSGNNTISAL